MIKKEEKKLKNRRLSGKVSSTKMKDTAVVVVSKYSKHPRYGKFIKTEKKYKAHDKGNTVSVGDKVIIEETKPVSKDKHFKIVKLSK
jgi:small subunit ribosomal protein S17